MEFLWQLPNPSLIFQRNVLCILLTAIAFASPCRASSSSGVLPLYSLKKRTFITRFKYHKIDCAYPQLVSNEPEKVTAANKLIKSWFLHELRSLESNLPDEKPAFLKNAEIWGGYDVKLQTNQLLSLKFQFGSFSGGAHPSHYKQGFTIEVLPARRITLSEIFGGKVNYEMLSDLCAAGIYKTSEDPDDHWIDEGTKPVAKNFSEFTVSPEGIEILFQEYQVACYACGAPDVVLPYKFLKPVMSKHCPVYQLTGSIKPDTTLNVTDVTSRKQYLVKSKRAATHPPKP